MNKLWRSGMILSIAGLLTGVGNYVFQGLIGRQLSKEEYGYVNTTIGFMGLLGLPLLIATTAVTHHIAHFRASEDHGRLRGLLLGCRTFLLRLTIVGSLLAVLLVKPLSDFFHFPRSSLMLVAVSCVIASMWGSLATALCQGMSWFKRLAFIGLASVGLRLAFGWFSTEEHPVAEAAVLATGFALLANLVLLYWRKELFGHGEAVSPWDKQFIQFLVASTACVGGGYCFTQGDLLVAQRNFQGDEIGVYSAAALLARALPMVVGPLLVVLFTSRSGRREGDIVKEQFRLLGLYTLGLICGAVALFIMRSFCVKLIFGKESTEAAAMIARLAITMVFVGLLQAVAMWALASRWLKSALLYGGLGVGYWLILLKYGASPQRLIELMPMASGIAFGILFTIWAISTKSVTNNDKQRLP